MYVWAAYNNDNNDVEFVCFDKKYWDETGFWSDCHDDEKCFEILESYGLICCMESVYESENPVASFDKLMDDPRFIHTPELVFDMPLWNPHDKIEFIAFWESEETKNNEDSDPLFLAQWKSKIDEHNQYYADNDPNVVCIMDELGFEENLEGLFMYDGDPEEGYAKLLSDDRFALRRDPHDHLGTRNVLFEPEIKSDDATIAEQAIKEIEKSLQGLLGSGWEVRITPRK